MIKRIVYLSILFIATQNTIAQNVGINTTGNAPDNSAMLDIDAFPSNDKGLLIPRVALSATNVATPITSPATSLMVYNTATAGTPPNNVTPGYYYWNGTVWVRVATDGDNWKLTGNAGTNPSTNFLGTTDANDLQIRTNNVNRMRIMNSTYPTVGIGTTGPVTNLSGNSAVLHVHDGGTSVGSQIILSTHSTTNGVRAGVINFAATQVTNDRRTASIESFLTDYTAPNATGDLRFFTNNANTFSEKMRIGGNGQVSIATTSPTANYLVTINPTTNVLRSGISIPMSGATSTAFGINISATNANSRGLFYSNSTTGAGVVFGTGAEITGGSPVSGYSAYRTSGSNNYGIYGITGTNATYNASNANAWAGFFQGRVVISSESAPTSLLGTDLEIRNTTTGAGNPVVISMRQSTSNATAGTVLTQLNFGDNYSTSAQAAIYAIRDAAGGVGDNPTALLFGTTLDGTSTLAEQMRITNAGNVGIGTTTPGRKLQIHNTVGQPAAASVRSEGVWSFFEGYCASNTSGHANVFIGLRGRGTLLSPTYPQTNDILTAFIGRDMIDGYSANWGGAVIDFRAEENFSSTAKGTYILFGTTNLGAGLPSEKMRLTANGFLGIGTASPLAPLDVRKNINYSAGNGTSQDGPTTAIITANNSSRHNDWPAGWGGGLSTWDICGASTFMTNNAIRSDERLKNNINNLSSTLNTLMKLRPVSYYMDKKYESDHKEHLHFGFIAQEVEKIYPNIVIKPESENGIYGLNYTELIPVLTKAIQEQQAIIESQKNEIDQLKKKSSEIDMLKAEIDFIKTQLNAHKQTSEK